MDHGNHENHGNRQQQPMEQKEKRSFCHPDDAEKWCEIHHTSGHDLEEYKTFLDRKKMPPPQAPQEQHRADADNEDQMDQINVIFGGSLSITSKTQGKTLEREISLAQRIEPDRKMKWSEVDISFGPYDHPEIELSNQNLPFVVKLPIGWDKVAKTLIDNGGFTHPHHEENIH
jgi:hypothetical protein